jgi:tetratricopeptide (TPR) repeat protein
VEGSVPLFRKAFDESLGAGEHGLAADAAHMLAMVLPDEHEQWAKRGLEVAEGSDDPLAWAMSGALLNNLGWKLADEQRWAEAYELFDRAVTARERVAGTVGGKASAGSLHVARWCRARAARALGRNEEALAELRELDQSDPYVQEEISLLS